MEAYDLLRKKTWSFDFYIRNLLHMFAIYQAIPSTYDGDLFNNCSSVHFQVCMHYHMQANNIQNTNAYACMLLTKFIVIIYDFLCLCIMSLL